MPGYGVPNGGRGQIDGLVSGPGSFYDGSGGINASNNRTAREGPPMSVSVLLVPYGFYNDVGLGMMF